ncbi:MAG TPA: hypothetical protein VFT95_04195 [Micromonosporaceae bacterium]|nr:hypothetical protein [Micromonosporaceae bacterium]
MEPHVAVKRELLVRLLDGWLPAALHGTRRATYLDGYATAGSVAAALGVVAEFPDLLARRRLGIVLVAAGGDDLGLTADVASIRREVDTPAGVSLQIVPHASGGRLPELEMPAGGPLLGYLDAAGATGVPEPDEVAALVTGARAQALLALDRAALAERPEPVEEAVERYRAALGGIGPAPVAAVELVAADGRAEVLLYRTPTPRGLEIFKDALWAVDEYAGVRYRDPRDPGHALLDISLKPHPGPLRRALLGRLAAGGRTVADLRQYALAETVYRAADVVPVLTQMVAAGSVRREPVRGRLTADAVISLP